ncbi:MAG TPA: DHA2 family efflux MFS transporter permease subunit [Longimicrobiales bacterium]
MRRWLILAPIGVGTFMSALDSSIVNIILPVVRGDLHATVAGVEWIAVVYLLIVSSLLLGAGRAGDLYGQKRFYCAGFLVFVLGSALCGFAHSLPTLVLYRAVQALGAAALFANAPAILSHVFAQERGRALGIVGTMTYLGVTTGPPLGGWIVSHFGWRWVFFINVPIGLLAFVLALRVIPDMRPSRQVERFDWLGAVLFAAGLIALLSALNQGHAWGWTSPQLLGLLLLGGVLAASFIAYESRITGPMLDLTLFQNATFSSTTVAALLQYVANVGAMFVAPFLLMQGRGLDPQHAGLIIAAQPLIMAATSPFSGIMSDRFGSRGLSIAGMALITVGEFLVALSAHAQSVWLIAAAFSLVGLGVGLFVTPNNSALLGAAPRHRQGIASGIMATARNVGMMLGIGVVGAVYTSLLPRGSGAHQAETVVHAATVSLMVAAATALLALLVTIVQRPAPRTSR